MTLPFYIKKPLQLTRQHFINQYPPFNVATVREVREINETKDLLLYIHIPFCPTICSYCFYKKFGNPSADVVETYLDHLKKEIELFSRRPEMPTKSVKTIYVGGGTPTILTCRQMQSLIAGLREHFQFHRTIEFCCEAMPHEKTLTRDKLEMLKELGVSRISFGVENLNDEILSMHNRHCTSDLYYRTYRMLQEIGFEKINVDIMSGMCGETRENWSRMIDTLIEWGPPSISIYKTEVFYNTTLFAAMRNGKPGPQLMSDNEEIEQIRYAHERLQSRGHYFPANCLHLLKDWKYDDIHARSVWQGTDFKGFGLSAHSCYDGFLHQNSSEMAEYLASIDAGSLPIKRAHRLSARDRISEAAVYGLKCLALSRPRFIERFGIDITSIYGELIAELVDEGVLTIGDEWLRVAPEYYIFVDDVCRQFFLPEYENMMLAHLARDAGSRLVSISA